MSTSGSVLSFPEDTAVDDDEFVPTEKSLGNRVFRQSTKPGNLKVLPTGGATARTIAAVAGDLDVTAGTVTASKAVVVDANKDIASFRDVTTRKVKIGDSANDHVITIESASDEAANRTLTVPALGGNETLAVLGTAQTFTGAKTFAAAIKTSLNVGTANTGTTAVEYGDGFNHHTVLTVATTLPAIAGGAALAVGKLLYTFPAGAIIVESAYMSLAITQSEGNITADTPDGGLGTVIGVGAVATLDGTGTFEDIITGQTFNDCNGTAEVKTATPTAGVPLVIEAGAAHTVHFNVADTWAASGDAAAALDGTVVLNWRFVV